MDSAAAAKLVTKQDAAASAKDHDKKKSCFVQLSKRWKAFRVEEEKTTSLPNLVNQMMTRVNDVNQAVAKFHLDASGNFTSLRKQVHRHALVHCMVVA